MVLLTNDVRQHHFHKQKIYLLRIFSIYPASISVKKGLFSSKQHRSTRRNNSLHPGYLTSLVTRTNHNTIQTIGIYVRVFRTDYHTGQIFIPHRLLSMTHSITLQLPSGLCYLCEGVYCRARLGAVFLTGHIFTSVCVSWYGRQLITIISDLVPSKKEISPIGGMQPNRRSQQQQLSVCLNLCCFFFKLFQ